MLNHLSIPQHRDLILAVAEFRQYFVGMDAAFRRGAHQAAWRPAQVDRLADNRRRAQLYQLVQEHIESFFAQVEAESGGVNAVG